MLRFFVKDIASELIDDITFLPSFLFSRHRQIYSENFRSIEKWNREDGTKKHRLKRLPRRYRFDELKFCFLKLYIKIINSNFILNISLYYAFEYIIKCNITI